MGRTMKYLLRLLEAPKQMRWYHLAAFSGITAVLAPLAIYNKSVRHDARVRREEEEDCSPMRIGGPFTLVRHDGVPVTSGDFLGRWVLLYFGFTNCPEICPEQLQKMVTVVDTVNAAYTFRKTVTPVFVSIDPPRDSCEEVHRFIRQFSSKIVGLCGTPAQVQAAARQWRVFYSVPDGHTAARDYLIDHSVVAYLVQPDGRLAGVYPAEFDTAEMAASIRRRITQFDRRPVFEGLFSSLDDGALDFPFGFFASQNARMERERARRIAEYAFIDAEEA